MMRDRGRDMKIGTIGLLLCAAMTLANAEIAAAQDAVAGEKTFNVCRACHQIGATARNSVGPVLNGVVGRKAGSYPDYAYSDANKSSGLTWDEATLKAYLKGPAAKVPGTKMLFPGLRKEQDIDNVIAFLKQYGPDGKIGEAPSPATSRSPL
jgi:cytochrome c